MSETTHYLPCISPGCFNMVEKGNYCDSCRESRKNKKSPGKPVKQTVMKTVVIAVCDTCKCEFEPKWTGSSYTINCKECSRTHRYAHEGFNRHHSHTIVQDDSSNALQK